jgi:ankyrin repeat protein
VEFSGNRDLCALLRARGGSDNVVDQQYRATPRVLLERLTADRTLVSLIGGRGTLLHAAAEGGQEAAARILLHFGADRSPRDPEGRTPVEVAQARGHAALAALLSP